MTRKGALIVAALTCLTAMLAAVLFWFSPTDSPSSDNESKAVRSQRLKLQKRLAGLRPQGLFIVVDTASNRLYLRRGDRILLEAVCSTGSGRRLTSGEKSWTFQTPKGEFAVLSKISNPVWRKPDWAFLEEGKAPPKDNRERFEKDVLGEYALGFGDGYFIHGTLYTRMLGRNVTHGCIRLASKDLTQLARTAPLGTRIYIF
jgi:lipoprotein-anchoring transpeptidase ErfK/SrfK